MDAHANFALSSVATAPSPASSGTSLVVAAGEGTRFPAAPFNATVWPVNSYPTPSNAEIVRITNRSTDTLTITRAQESSSARTIVGGDLIAATITAKTLTDIETGATPGDTTVTEAKLTQTHHARVYNANTVSVANTTDVAIPFDGETLDKPNDDQHSNSTNNTRLTCKLAGTYLLIAYIEFPSTNTTIGFRDCYFKLNGSTRPREILFPPVNNQVTRLTLSTLTALALNDYIEFYVYQNSTATHTIAASGAGLEWARISS